MKHLKRFRLNEGTSYEDFLDTYYSEIMSVISKFSKIESWIKRYEISDSLYDEIYDKLEVYDDNVISHLENWAQLGVTEHEIVRLAISNQDRYGTEPKMIIDAMNDFYDVLLKGLLPVSPAI